MSDPIATATRSHTGVGRTRTWIRKSHRQAALAADRGKCGMAGVCHPLENARQAVKDVEAIVKALHKASGFTGGPFARLGAGTYGITRA